MATVAERAEDLLPPRIERPGPIGWMRRNLFASVSDTLLTLLVVAFLVWAIPPLVRWAVLDATLSGTSKEACNFDAACWTVVKVRLDQFFFGLYPREEQWRVVLAGIILLLAFVPYALPRFAYKLPYTAILVLFGPWLLSLVLTGGRLGLAPVQAVSLGGLALTLVIAIVGIAASLPIGILLALGRRSNMPVIKSLCVTLIEIVRGVPLVTVLFMASVMLPLFFPPGWNVEKVTRALIGVSLFSGAYMAEVIRGGLQAIPRGQYEAAKAIGLGYWQSMGLIILPQALRLVIPGIVNTFIGLFKDTSLVFIMGLYDLLGIARLIVADPAWLGLDAETYITAGLGFWIFCFAMSRYSQGLERRLAKGTRH
jgi:general L-amino acid transport system permease protein